MCTGRGNDWLLHDTPSSLPDGTECLPHLVSIDGFGAEPTREAPPEKNPAAVALGRLGGKKGGKARAEKLSPERRSEIAQKAARTRWNKADSEG